MILFDKKIGTGYTKGRNREEDIVLVKFNYLDYTITFIPFEPFGEITPTIPLEVLVEEVGRTYVYDYDNNKWELKDKEDGI